MSAFMCAKTLLNSHNHRLKKYTIAIIFIIISSFSIFADDKLSNVSGEPVYIVGSEIDYPPFCIVDEEGNANGFSVDLIKAVCNAMNLKIKIRPGLRKDIKQELAEGKIDILPLVGRSPERDKMFDFTIPYQTLHGAVFAKKGSRGIENLSDLKHKHIAVMKGDNAHEYILNSELSDTITPTDTFKIAFNMLSKGQCDAVIAQKLLGLQLVETLNINNIQPLDINLKGFAQDFSIAVKEGNDELLSKLNEGLAIIIADGTYDRLHEKWLHPITIYKISHLEKLKLSIPYLSALAFVGILLSLLFTKREVKNKTITLHETIKHITEAQKKLSNSEKRYRTLIETAMDGIWIVDMNGNIIETNQSYADISGYTCEELLTMKISDLDISESDEDVKKNIARIKELKHLRFEKVHKRKDGSPLPLEISVQYTDLNNGSIVSYMRDISERVQAEIAFKKSEAMFRNLSENSPAVTYRFKKAQDGTLSFTYINDKVFDIMGYSPQSVLKDASLLLKSIHPEDKLLYINAQETSAENISSFHLIFRVIVEEKVKWLEARSNPTKMENGDIIWDGLFFDISDKINAEKKYTSLFNEMLDGFALHKIILDDKGVPVDYQFITVNPAFEEMTGLKGSEIIGKTVLEVLPGTELHWIKTYGKVALDGEPIFFENYTSTLNSYFEVKAFQTEPLHFACIFTDVTDRKLKEEKQKQLEEQIRQNQKMDAIGTLAGGIAHDFNNMLGIMSGLNEINMLEVDKKTLLYDNMLELQATIERASSLPKQLLTFSRKAVVNIKSVNLNQLIHDIWKMLTRVAGEDIQLTKHLSHLPLLIDGDEGQIQQILMNLIINASFELRNMSTHTVKAISITTEYLELYENKPFFMEKNIAPGKFTVIRVKDNGPGISKTIQERIFEPFFTTKKFGSGTGLGLSTVFGIVNEAKGHVFVDSESGEGAEFIILWPISSETEVDRTETEPRKIKAGKGHILIVEDEEQLLKIADKALSYAGYQTSKASNAEQAETIIKTTEHHLDLLFSDIILPGKDGVSLAEEFLKIFPKSKILFASGYSEDRFKKNTLPDRSFKLISKPYTPSQLTEEIFTLLIKSTGNK